MEMLSSKQKKVIIAAGVFFVFIFMYYMTTINRGFDYSDVNEDIENVTEEIISKEEEKEKEIIIHITGAVQTEGIVRIREGDRIKDAIENAGGLAIDADLTEVNLAYVLKDGQKIYIPRILDTEEEIIIKEENGESVIVDEQVENINIKININTATSAELQTLSGIGEGTAQKIVEHRQLNGRFNTIEDIKNVSGIGEAKFETIKEYICVD